MSRIMGDSSTFGNVPPMVDIVAAYANGKYGVATPEQMEAKYPNAHYGHVLIDVNGSRPDVQVRDWETGDKAGSLEQWVIDHNKASGVKDAVIYCNKSTIEEVRQLTGSQILAEDYFLWVATLDNSIYTQTGVIACQNKGSAQTGGHYDTSVVVNDDFWKSGNTITIPAPVPGAPIIIQVPTKVKPSCIPFQEAIRTPADNMWGTDTDNHANAIIKASAGKFPYGVIFAQQVVGTQRDGMWGKNSKLALKLTVANAQRALDVMGFSPGGADGIWGPNTSAAYTQARAACHI